MKSTGVFVFGCIFVAGLVQISSAQTGSPPALFKCVDWDCEEWISKGKTLLLYMGRTDKHLSFKKNQDILIVGKPVDENSPDWVGKIGDQVGLIPKDYVREDKMGKSPPKFTVGLHEIAGWSMNKDKMGLEDQADDEEDDENEAGIEDIGEVDNDIDIDGSPEVQPGESREVEEKVAIPESQPPESDDADAAAQSSVEDLQEPIAQPDINAFQQEPSSSSNQMEPEAQNLTGNAEESVSKEDEVASDPELNSVSLQSSNETIHPPENSSVSEETQFAEHIEVKAEDVEESAGKSEMEVESEVNIEDIKISPRTLETVEPENLPEIVPMENTTSSPEIVSEIPTPEVDSSTPMPPASPELPVIEDGPLDEPAVPEPAPESESSDTLSSDPDVDDLSKQSEESQISDEFATTEKNQDEENSTSQDSTDSAATSSPESEIVSPEIASVEESKPTEEVASEIPNHDDHELTDQLKHEEIPSPTEEVVSAPQVEEVSTPGPDVEDTSSPSPQVDDDSYQVNEASPPQVEEISSPEGHEISSPQLEEVSPPHLEETSPPQEEMVSPAQDEEVLTPQMEETSPPQMEEVSTPQAEAEEISSSPRPISPEENSHDVPQEEVEEPHEAHADHDHHHHHHHRHNLFKDTNDTETSSLILVIKHISSTLLSFLPEPLQDTILDVDDALVLTGIIALTLVSICVPYFLIEAHMSLRPLKKKVVELNKSLWKVSAAYETQQEEFEIFKQKAIAHDEFKKRAEQSGNDLAILKMLDTKHREQITALKNQLKTQMKEAVDIRGLIERTLEAKKVVAEECEKYKVVYESTKEALRSAKDELNSIQTQAKSSSLLLSVSGKNAEVLNSKVTMLEQETEDMKSQLVAENEKRKAVEVEKHEVEQAKAVVEKELTELKNICHQYESTVSDLNDEISKLESELTTIKETLGEDSPLLEVAEIQAKAAFSERETESLRIRLGGLTADNENLSGKVKEMSSSLEDARNETEKTNNRLQVLEKYFKEREEEYMKTIEQLQLKESVRDKGKEELIKIIEEKDSVCKNLDDRLEALKEEFEETKQQHRNEIRNLEAKGHENWLSLCQAERKAQDARKEAQQLRQRLTALSKERDDEDGDGLNGEVPMFPVLPDELVPLPIFDESPYFSLGGDFEPPPPLPEGGEREPHRPPPLGGRLSPSFSDFDDNLMSPIGVGRRDEDCTDGSSGSNSPRRSPPLRGGWVNVSNDHEGQGRENIIRLPRETSSPVPRGVNL